MSDRTIALVMGIVAGVLICCVGGLFLLAAGATPKPATMAIPAEALIEAQVTEEYVNRIFSENIAGQNSPMSIEGGRIDILPGNRLKYVVQVNSPVGLLTVRGFVTLTVQKNELRIHIAEVRAGQLPITPLARPFLSAVESQAHTEIARLIAERTAPAKLKLVSVNTDETALRVHFATIR